MIGSHGSLNDSWSVTFCDAVNPASASSLAPMLKLPVGGLVSPGQGPPGVVVVVVVAGGAVVVVVAEVVVVVVPPWLPMVTVPGVNSVDDRTTLFTPLAAGAL